MDTPLVDSREIRGAQIAKAMRLKKITDRHWLVPSQTGAGKYVVDPDHGTCSCPDHETRRVRCKHIFAVEYARHHIVMPDGSKVIAETMKVTYSQNWPAYRAARMNEKELFEKLLRALCNGVVQPTYKGNGRPSLPLSDVIFAAGVKTFTLFSGDRAQSDIRSCKVRGLTDVVPHPNTVFRIMRDPEMVPVLRRLIEESAKPLRTAEVDFAADGTGVATKSYVRWFDDKWGKDRREKKWLKLHMMVGVKTQIITGVEVTAGNAHDSPFLPSLIAQTGKTFKMREVSADMGYLGRENFKAIVAAGAEPFIPFKSNSKESDDDLWNRLFAYYTYNQPTFLAHYHKRSLSEATFSAIKRVLGASVRAKTFDGQVAEVYMKVLCHNLRVLVQSMFELGIDASFWDPSALPIQAEVAQ